MVPNQKLKTFIGWLVKIAGAGVLVLVLAFAVGEGMPNPLKLTGKELLLFGCFIISSAGLVLAFWRQGFGGVLILGGLIGFNTIQGKFTSGWVFLVIGLVGILNIVCAKVKK